MRKRTLALALRLTFALGMIACVCGVGVRTAFAHPDLDRAVKSAEDADFDAALASFEKALDSGSLTRAELVTLLSERALVLHALGQRGALAWDLANLALLEPGRDLGRRAPPELVRAFERASARQRAAVEISVSCAPSRTGMRVTADVKGLSDPSLGTVVIHTRLADSDQVKHEGTRAEVEVEAGESFLYSAELVGIGKVPIARDGSPAAPKVCEAPDLTEAGALGTDKRDGKNRKLWWWIGAGSVAVVTAVTVGILVANDQERSTETSVGRPMVRFE